MALEVTTNNLKW